MTDVIRIKRRISGAIGAPAGLANAELAYNEVDHTLYYGEGTGGVGGSATVVVPIAGQGLGSNSLPLMNGAAASGTSPYWSRSDHVHPRDTSSIVSSGDTPPASPIPGQLWFDGISTQLYTFYNDGNSSQWIVANNLQSGIYLPLSGGSMTGTLTLHADPSGPFDAATKQYVDAAAQGLGNAKLACRVATTANIALSGLQTIDGIALAGADRVLVKDQTATQDNGIYIVGGGTWTRATDMDIWAEVPSAFTFVEQGTVNADTGWLCTSDPGGSIGTTSITWVQFSAAGQITAGNGLNKVGNVLNVVGTTNRIAVGASVDIDVNYAGQGSINTVGNITAGTWNGSLIVVGRGGTGVGSLTGYVKGNGVAAFSAVATIPATDITGLGTMAAQNSNAVSITGGTIDGITFDGGTF
jgi:hypothetical protein